MRPPITERQVSYLTSLLAEREHTLPLSAADVPSLNRTAASAYINMLVTSPRKPRPSLERDPAAARAADLLSTATKGHYALEDERGTLTFLQIRKRYNRDRLQIVRLHGAPGGFSRSYMPAREEVLWLERIAEDEFGAMFRFAEHYTVCGRCAAELTDEASRERKFGPDCWGILGKDGLLPAATA